MSYVQLAVMAAAEVANLLTAPATQGGAQLNSLKVSASTFGKSIPFGFGTQRQPGNIIWSLPLRQYTHNGKGLGQSAYSYNWTGAVALGEGPIDDILQIYADTKIVFDKTGEYGADLCNQNAGTYPNPIRFTLYKGTEDQMPDPNIIELVGEEFATAHRGMAYVVIENTPVTNFGNRVPNWNFVVSYSGNAQNFTVQNFTPTYDGGPAAPLQALAAMDWGDNPTGVGRNTVYFRFSTPEPGIVACSLNTGETINSREDTDIFADFPDWNGFELFGSMVVGTDGYLYMQNSAADAIFKVDADALVCVGEFTLPTGFIGDLVLNIVPSQINGTNYLTLQGQFGATLTICADTMMVGNLFVGETSETDGFGFFGVTNLGPGITIAEGTATLFLTYLPSDDSGVQIYEIFIAGNGAVSRTLITTLLPGQVNINWTVITAIAGLASDITDGNIILAVADVTDSPPVGVSQAYIIKVSATSGSVLWAVPVNEVPNPSFWFTAFSQSAITDGQYCFIGNEDASYNGAGDHSPTGYVGLYTVDTVFGTATRANWAIPDHGYQEYNGSQGVILYYGQLNPTYTSDQWLLIYTDRAASAAVPVSGVVQAICEKVGYVSGDLDTSLLDTANLNVDGYVIGESKSAAETLKPLMFAFQFDAVETDLVLRFVPRGQASSVTVPESALSIIDKKTNALSQETRIQEVDIPRVMTISFFDPTRDYQASYQYSQRSANPVPTMFSNNRKSASIDMVASADFAKQLADKVLYSSWAERTTYKTRLSWEFLVLDPTDVITLTLSDDTQVVTRILAMDVGADLSIDLSSVSQLAETYSSNSTTDGGNNYPQNTNTAFGTKLMLLDVPILRDIDDPGFSFTIMYWAGGAYTPQWPGVELWLSTDGTSYTDQDGVTTSASWGVVINTLADAAKPFATDRVNTLTVGMTQGGDNLASITYLQMMNGANAAAVFNPLTGLVEIVQFMNVTQNADGTFTLDTLLRGRRGTEVYTSTHVAGEYFVLLATDSGSVSPGVNTINLPLSDLNDPLYFKGVPNGTLLANATQTNFTDTGRTLKPYAPVHIKAATSGSDIALTWLRRTRLHGELEDGTGTVPLYEQDEHYQVDIYNALGTMILRTLDIDYHSTVPQTTPGVTYTDAEYTADFGSKPTSLNLMVYQMGTIGRGFAKMYNVIVDGLATP